MLKIKFFLPLIFAAAFSAQAYGEASLIRDAQTEKLLHEIANPIFLAANLDPKNIKIYIVNDDSINAFVSGGQNVFINIGLITKYPTPDALIGVLAHETGHITGGHLARSSEGQSEAQGAMLLSYLLGIGAAAAGAPDAAAALILGGSQTAQRLYARFTRTQEEAADQYAIQYLAKLRYPADGLVNLLEFFEAESKANANQIDEYLLSHPVSRKRIDLIKARTASQNFSDKKINQKLQHAFTLTLAKLEGFTKNPQSTLEKYKNRTDDAALYAKSIALFKKGEVPAAAQMLDELIKRNPNDGFFYEMKGQILFEGGKVADAALAYNQAVKHLSASDAALAKISLAEAILNVKGSDKDLAKLAISRLKEAKIFEEENPFLFKELATAYNKTGDKAASLLNLAEFNCLIGQKEKCQKYAKQAKDKFDKASKTELLHADDLLEMAKEKKEEKE